MPVFLKDVLEWILEMLGDAFNLLKGFMSFIVAATIAFIVIALLLTAAFKTIDWIMKPAPQQAEKDR